MKKKIIIGAVLFLVVILLIVTFTSKEHTSEGVAYIKEQEALKTKKLSKKLTNKRIEEKTTLIKEGKIDVFSMFDDYALYGDSRVYGFGSYGFLPWNNVFAAAGNTILNITDFNDQVKQINPSNLYFSYGVNDMGLDLKKEGGTYADLYEEKVKEVLKIVPKAHVFINSIIPPTAETLAENPRWDRANEYNTQLKAMCEKNGWTYIDVTSVTDDGDPKYYQADGVHFIRDIYPIWAQKMIDATINEEEHSK